MKRAIWHAAAVWLALVAVSYAAPSPVDVTGNWLGTVNISQTKLRLLFKISKTPEGALVAKMDSLDQGMRDMKVDTVTVKDNTLRLEVKLIEGVYEGILDAAGKATGHWVQGDQSVPLNLQRLKGNATSEPEVLAPADAAANKIAAQKLAGEWNGTLNADKLSIPLAMTISRTAEGAATGTMDSPQQGLKGIPLSAITYKDGKVHFEARGLTVTYDGVSFNNSTSLTGQWHQANQTLSLNFRKSVAGTNSPTGEKH